MVVATVEVPGAAEGGALGLHEGIRDNEGGERLTRCERWPSWLALRSTLDNVVRGRCKAVNLCDYCARLAAVENTEVLWLDAMEGVAPMVWCVLGTGTDSLDPSLFYDARKHLVKAVRRGFPHREIEWCALVEFTTGYSKQSGGRRYPHWNVLWKGLGPDDLSKLQAIIDRVWCGRPEFKAVPEAQHVGTIREAGGLTKYLALHFQKESQSPPRGWRGHRFLHSRPRPGKSGSGYLWLPAPEAREAARQSLRLKRLLRCAERDGLVGEAALERAHLELYEANELAWELVYVVPAEFGEDDLPTAWMAGPEVRQ